VSSERSLFAGTARLGIVREVDGALKYPQVCELLASRGNTLTADVGSLADVIRREYRAMRASERRWAAQWK
jgi:hypothetical protein